MRTVKAKELIDHIGRTPYLRKLRDRLWREVKLDHRRRGADHVRRHLVDPAFNDLLMATKEDLQMKAKQRNKVAEHYRLIFEDIDPDRMLGAA